MPENEGVATQKEQKIKEVMLEESRALMVSSSREVGSDKISAHRLRTIVVFRGKVPEKHRQRWVRRQQHA